MPYRLLGLLLLVIGMAANAQPAGPFTAGKDYHEIEPAQPTASGERIEVIEVFGYACGGCAGFQPHVNSWKARLPDDVAFSYVPAAWSGVWEAYARAFYAAETLGLVEKTHDALFTAIHVERRQFRGEDDIAAFYAEHGADKAQFLATMKSFGVNAKIARSRQQVPRYGVESTPTMVVAGKYRVRLPAEGGFERLLQIVDFLIARERSTSASAA
jgi:protein dithiol oxidoreductase (disulfide-forming)